MDESLSRLVPSYRVGNDGFQWWIGQIEGTAQNEENNKGGYRYKVAIVGEHPLQKEALNVKQLPWANVMMPVTAPFTPGAIGGAHPQLIPGCWVLGFYMDHDRSQPVILGSIGQTPGATSVINNEDPNDPERFKTVIKTDEFAPIDTVDGIEGSKNGLQTQVVISDGSTDGNGDERVDLGTRKEEDFKRE